MKVVIDAKLETLELNMKEESASRRLILPKNTQVLAINVTGNHILECRGILASFSNGIVTDGSWKCVGNKPKSSSSGNGAWNTLASVGGPNNDPEHREISSNAQWIWIRNSPDKTIYCEKTFGKFN